MTNYDEYRVTNLYRHILHHFATRFPNMFSFNCPVRQLINTAAPLTCAHTQVSVNKHVWILPASLTLPQVHKCHQNHYDPFNSLAAGRCGYSFNSITFKLILQTSSLDIHCKLLPDKCHKIKESSAVVQVMVWSHEAASHHQSQCWPRSRFLSLARSKLRLCSANYMPGYRNNLSCD